MTWGGLGWRTLLLHRRQRRGLLVERLLEHRERLLAVRDAALRDGGEEELQAHDAACHRLVRDGAPPQLGGDVVALEVEALERRATALHRVVHSVEDLGLTGLLLLRRVEHAAQARELLLRVGGVLRELCTRAGTS